ncbi:single-strand selective monofunctional uracil-DNA glycosylase [Drosophila subpulchrella]|uniref:single-strand selective monofunctional uracil-DNA glycosylase n=1 Tax=Drosophila subpulchrella TaxID=1486046 RepID=UPI0018A14152|nr:single-strand selective monofunctional uracil-DNA glycosylase [Drosophila subpulchrella]
MLKRKLNQQKDNLEDVESKKSLPNEESTISDFFSQPLWLKFYNTEVKLNEVLEELTPPPNIKCIYNPIVYASQLHCDYVRRFLSGPKKLVFIGMNPGPNGMAQTGIPFGNVRTVKLLLQLSGSVDKPPVEHPKRPVLGLDCKIEEPSGVRLWELFLRLAGNVNIFTQQCFVHNFCPLAFFDEAGKNLTPSELKGPYKKQLRDLCLETLEEQLVLLKPQVLVAVGEYVHTALKGSRYCQSDAVSVLRLPHPSPRSVNNNDWPNKARAFLEENNLIRFLRNEA